MSHVDVEVHNTDSLHLSPVELLVRDQTTYITFLFLPPGLEFPENPVMNSTLRID